MTASRRNKLGKMGLPKEGSPRARGRRTNAHAPVRILKRRDGGGTAPRRAAVARCGRGACQGERARDIKASVKATLVPQIVATAEVACLKQKKGLRVGGTGAYSSAGAASSSEQMSKKLVGDGRVLAGAFGICGSGVSARTGAAGLGASSAAIKSNLACSSPSVPFLRS